MVGDDPAMTAHTEFCYSTNSGNGGFQDIPASQPENRHRQVWVELGHLIKFSGN